MTGATGDLNLRSENVERVVTGFALQNYIFKDSLMISKSNSWKETYWRETAGDLTGGLGSAVKGIPRLANFPYGQVTWSEISNRIEKYGMEGVISYEDWKTNEIDVISRTLLRIARAVAKAVDDEIYSQISTNAGNSIAIAAGNEWDSATITNRDPIQNILNAIREISIDNYDVLAQKGELWLNPTDFANIMGNANVRNAGQFWTSDVTKNGKVGRMCGLTVKVSNSVTADEAMVMVPKIAGTWKQVSALTVKSIEDPGIKWTIRAWELGVTQVTNPNACCKITNTAA